MKALTTLTFLVAVLCFLVSCKKSQEIQPSPSEVKKQIVDTHAVSSLDSKFNEAKQVIYSLPSPQEVTYILFDKNETKFDPSVLNSISSLDNYTTDLSKALNLGIYSADVSFATIMEQNQIAVDYMEAAKKLADQLGILNYFTQEDIKRIENNITNRDELMKIITEAYMKTDAQLQADQRDEIGALILIGGWVEGMYIAVSLVNCNVKQNPKLVGSILEQQLSLDLLTEFLQYYKNSKILSEISSDLYELDKIFQKITTDIDQNGNITTNQKDFERICKKIKAIRQSYVKMI